MYQWFIFSIVAAATASVLHDGNCPDIKPVENFNVSAYTGLWYEISKYPNEAEKNGNCATAEYTLDGEVVKVKNVHIVNGVQSSVGGTAKLAPDANNSGKLLVALEFGELTREQPLWVVATDYTSYAVAYACTYDEKKKSHQDSIWILSRAKTLEGDAKTGVDNFLKANKEIDQSKLVYSDFSEEACKFTSTGVVTEPAKKNH